MLDFFVVGWQDTGVGEMFANGMGAQRSTHCLTHPKRCGILCKMCELNELYIRTPAHT